MTSPLLTRYFWTLTLEHSITAAASSAAALLGAVSLTDLSATWQQIVATSALAGAVTLLKSLSSISVGNAGTPEIARVPFK